MVIRQHWSIENNLHWQMDVTFREDHSKKIVNTARNFSAVTKMAFTILKDDKATKEKYLAHYSGRFDNRI